MMRPPPRPTLFPYTTLFRSLSTELRLSRQGLGLDPGALSLGGLLLPPPPGSQWSRSKLRSQELNYHGFLRAPMRIGRSEEHTSELQSRLHLVCRLLLEKKKK